MSTDYGVIVEALTGFVSATMAEEDLTKGGAGSANLPAKIRVAVVDGEVSLAGSEDNSFPSKLCFRGCKCVAEMMDVENGGTGGGCLDASDRSPHGVVFRESIHRDCKSCVMAWLDSIDEQAPPPPMELSEVSSSPLSVGSPGEERGSGDELVPEDFFYTTQCPDINHLRSLSMVNRWTETEFVVWDDANDVTKLTEEELDFYKFIFVFLSAADDLVNLNLGHLQNLFRQKDILHYYVEQQSIEAVHSRVYGLIQLMLFGNNSMARADYVRRSVADPAIVSKIRWLDTKVSECDSVAEKYVLMAIIEGIFFSSSFAAIAYLRTNNLFTVTCQLNTLISRDEAVHTTASCIIYNNYLKEHAKPSPRRIHALFKEAVAIECAFLRSRAPSTGHLLNLEAICSYVRYSADRILGLLHLPSVFDEPKPPSEFPMALMFTDDNTNFFERRSTAYSGCVTNDL